MVWCPPPPPPPPLFAWVCLEKGRRSRLLRRPHFSLIKRVQTATLSCSVNSEDFLIDEADHVQIQPSTRRDLPTSPASRQRTCGDHGCDGPPDGALCGSPTDASAYKRMAFRELVRHNVERFDTIVTEIRPCYSSMNSRISSKSAGVRSCCLPPTITWATGSPRLIAATR